MGWTPEQLAGYAKVHEATVVLLDELQTKGFPNKRVREFHFCALPGTAAWHGLDEERGDIVIFLGTEPGAVAHELGHGFHECLRKNRSPDNTFGEAYAEAIRWFVEQRLGPSRWRDSFRARNHDAEILKACDYNLTNFITRLSSGLYNPT